MKKIIIALVVFSFIGCKKDNSAENERIIKEILNHQSSEVQVDEGYSLDNYEENFDLLIKKYDSKMRVVLAKQIDNQLTMYNSLLVDLSKVKKTSISDEEFKSNVEKLQQQVLKDLVESEIVVNVDYFEFLNELHELTQKYKKLNPGANLKRYDALDRIELSEGVRQKIEELAQDEKLKADTNIGEKVLEGLSFLAYMPKAPVLAVGFAADVALQFREELHIAKKKEASGYHAQIDKEELIDRIKQNLPADIYDVKSNSFSTKASTKDRNKALATTLNQINRANLDLERDFKLYHNIRNNPKGRIGDYSDGIWTVHYQNMLKIKNENLKALSAK
ncbi:MULTISPECIES: hypothetical protein [unclassified Myroides]|uniref:hypothetical protein n=1 Tax=unclassified Myroides TaxID=2642485 RepID=UPI003D2F828D